jgi:hypothetical protein
MQQSRSQAIFFSDKLSNDSNTQGGKFLFCGLSLILSDDPGQRAPVKSHCPWDSLNCYNSMFRSFIILTEDKQIIDDHKAAMFLGFWIISKIERKQMMHCRWYVQLS